MSSVLRLASTAWKRKVSLLRDMADAASTDQEADAIFGLAIDIAAAAGKETYAWDYFIAAPRYRLEAA